METEHPAAIEKMRYILESERERHRLEVQAALLEPFTRRFLASAGLSRGMRVLDVGTGAGDVAFLAAEIVGPTGSVLGVDCEERMIHHAQQRAQARQIRNIQFQAGSLLPDEQLGRFDLVIGRLVTAFQPDPLSFLRQVISRMKAGGSIALMEAAWNLCGPWTTPTIPAYDALLDRAVSLSETMGFDSRLGSRLTQLFARAGLGQPTVSAELLVSGPGSDLLRYSLLNFECLFHTASNKGLEVPDASTLTVICNEIIETAKASHVQFSGPCVVGAFVQIK